MPVTGARASAAKITLDAADFARLSTLARGWPCVAANGIIRVARCWTWISIFRESLPHPLVFGRWFAVFASNRLAGSGSKTNEARSGSIGPDGNCLHHPAKHLSRRATEWLPVEPGSIHAKSVMSTRSSRSLTTCQTSSVRCGGCECAKLTGKSPSLTPFASAIRHNRSRRSRSYGSREWGTARNAAGLKT